MANVSRMKSFFARIQVLRVCVVVSPVGQGNKFEHGGQSMEEVFGDENTSSKRPLTVCLRQLAEDTSMCRWIVQPLAVKRWWRWFLIWFAHAWPALGGDWMNLNTY